MYTKLANIVCDMLSIGSSFQKALRDGIEPVEDFWPKDDEEDMERLIIDAPDKGLFVT